MPQAHSGLLYDVSGQGTAKNALPRGAGRQVSSGWNASCFIMICTFNHSTLELEKPQHIGMDSLATHGNVAECNQRLLS